MRDISEDSHFTGSCALKGGRDGNIISVILEFRSIWACGGRWKESGEETETEKQLSQRGREDREFGI